MCIYVLMYVCATFGVKRDEAVTQRPILHRFIEYDFLREDDYCDVLKLTKALHDLGHRLGVGLLHHGADPHHNLTL